jgi:acyl dehydratase
MTSAGSPPAATLLPGSRFDLGSSDPITRQQIARYAGASGDYLPVHVDEPYALDHGFPSVMVPGLWTMGFAGRLLGEWIGTERITRFGGRFKCAVWPGDVISVEVTVGETEPAADPPHLTVEVTVRNQQRVVVFAGSADVLTQR